MGQAQYEYRASMAIIYFGVGCVVGAVPLLFALPMVVGDPRGLPMGLRVAAMLSPLLVGGFFGLRTALAGREQCSLGVALKRAFFLGGAS